MIQLTTHHKRPQLQSLENNLHISLNLELLCMESYNIERRMMCEKKKLRLCINCIKLTVQAESTIINVVFHAFGIVFYNLCASRILMIESSIETDNCAH